MRTHSKVVSDLQNNLAYQGFHLLNLYYYSNHVHAGVKELKKAGATNPEAIKDLDIYTKGILEENERVLKRFGKAFGTNYLDESSAETLSFLFADIADKLKTVKNKEHFLKYLEDYKDQ